MHLVTPPWEVVAETSSFLSVSKGIEFHPDAPVTKE